MHVFTIRYTLIPGKGIDNAHILTFQLFLSTVDSGKCEILTSQHAVEILVETKAAEKRSNVNTYLHHIHSGMETCFYTTVNTVNSLFPLLLLSSVHNNLDRIPAIQTRHGEMICCQGLARPEKNVGSLHGIESQYHFCINNFHAAVMSRRQAIICKSFEFHSLFPLYSRYYICHLSIHTHLDQIPAIQTRPGWDDLLSRLNPKRTV